MSGARSTPYSVTPGRSLATAPLIASGLVIGLLAVAAREPDRFSQQTTRSLRRAADEISVAVGRLWLAERAGDREHAAAFLAEVDSLLAGATDVEDITILGLESSVVYEPAVADCAVGGDFYDLFQAGADRWFLVLGDVCGNGPEAAAVTVLARHAARLLARDGHGATAVLERLNRAVADDYAPDRFLSMLCVELVPLDGGGARLRLASAGHPLPLLLRADGQVEQAARPQLLLGVFLYSLTVGGLDRFQNPMASRSSRTVPRPG